VLVQRENVRDLLSRNVGFNRVLQSVRA